MIKIFNFLLLLLFLASCDNFKNTDPNVKKSTAGICHKKGSQYYNQTKNFESFATITDCLNSGGE